MNSHIPLVRFLSKAAIFSSVAISILGTTPYGPSFAFAQGAAGVAIGGVVGKQVLDEAEQKARDLLTLAQSSGDYLMWQFATNMIGLIEKTRLEASGLLEETVDAIGTQRNQSFFQIQQLLGEAETNLQGAYLKADELTANLADTIGRIPFADKSAELVSVQPAALPPLAVEKIIEFIGPGLGESRAVATLPTGEKVSLTPKSGVSAYLKLIPLDYASSDGSANFIEIQVEFVKSTAAWYCLWCSDEVVTRTIPVVVPQEVPGKVRLFHTMETSETFRESFVVALNTAGKRVNRDHPVSIPPHLKDAGFLVDTAAVTASTQPGGKSLITRVWGNSGSCPGVDLGTLRNDGFMFTVYAGATCDVFGCDGGNQTCEIAVPLIRTVVSTSPVAGEFQNLSWLAATNLFPDPAAKSVLIELEKPDGSRVQFPPSERILEVTVTQDAETGGYRVVPFIGSAGQK